MKGKYHSDRDAILHYLTTSGWGNASFGDVNEYGCHVTRISNEPADVGLANTEFNSLMDAELHVEDSPELRAQLVGHFLVLEGVDGRVEVVDFSDALLLDQAYRVAEERYNELTARLDNATS